MVREMGAKGSLGVIITGVSGGGLTKVRESGLSKGEYTIEWWCNGWSR